MAAKDNINATEICLNISIPLLIQGDMPYRTLPPTPPADHLIWNRRAFPLAIDQPRSWRAETSTARLVFVSRLTEQWDVIRILSVSLKLP